MYFKDFHGNHIVVFIKTILFLLSAVKLHRVHNSTKVTNNSTTFQSELNEIQRRLVHYLKVIKVECRAGGSKKFFNKQTAEQGAINQQ